MSYSKAQDTVLFSKGIVKEPCTYWCTGLHISVYVATETEDPPARSRVTEASDHTSGYLQKRFYWLYVREKYSDDELLFVTRM